MNKRMKEIHDKYGLEVDIRPLYGYQNSDILSESLYQLFRSNSSSGSEDYTIVMRYTKDYGTQIEPYIKTQWYQRGPFGKYAPNEKAGCAVIAAGQLMYYFQFPTTYDWVAMSENNFNNETLSRFSKDLQDRFHVTYYEHDTGAWVVDGYNEYDYQYYFVVEYLRGSSGNYYYERDNITYSADDGNPAVTCQTHYNWGWGGVNNGYYASPPTYKNDIQQLILKH